MKLLHVVVVFAAAVAATTGDEGPGRWAEERRRIREALFVPDPLPPLLPETHGRFEPVAGVVAERVTYGTQFDMRVPAILYLPKDRAGRIPAIVVVNGHGGDKYSWYAQYSGMLYARAGAAVLTYDPIGEGERNAERRSGTRAHDSVEPPRELGRRMGGLMMTDLMQAVSYLSGRPEVDSKRIAAVGYSMGSFVLGLGCAVEERLRACVLTGGGNLDGPGEYWDTSKQMCQGIPYQSLMFLGDRAAKLYAMQASRGPALVYNGLEDDILQSKRRDPVAHFDDLRRRAATLHGSQDNIFENGYVPGVGHRPFFVTRPVALWLERRIDFPQWTTRQIDSMPETVIGEWAAKHSVAMDRLYATDHREAGTRALGSGIPGIPREDLNVLPPERWRQLKDRLIYESWLSFAKERVAAQGK